MALNKMGRMIKPSRPEEVLNELLGDNQMQINIMVNADEIVL